MKFKGTYILLMGTLILGVYIYFGEIKKSEKDQDLKEKSEKILIFEAEKVKKLFFRNAFGETEVEKDPQNIWRMTKPVEDVADEATVTSVLSSLGMEKYDEVVGEGDGDLKQYGLDFPKSSLTLTFANGTGKTLLVGSDAALSGKVYTKISDEKRVLFASFSLKSLVEKGQRDLRDKRIYKKHRDDIKGIILNVNVGPNKSTTELSFKDNAWYVLKPYADRGDADTVQSIINGVDSLRATDFPSEKSDQPVELKKFSLDKPDVEITLKDKDGKVLDVLSVGPKKQTSSFVKNLSSKTIYQVFTNASEQFEKGPEAFRDKKSFLDFNKEAVTSLSIKTDLADFSFVKKDDAWELSVPSADKTVNQLQMATLISKLGELRVTEFIPGSSLGMPKPKGEIILKGPKDEVLLDFKWGDLTESGKSTLAITQKSKRFFGVDPAIIKAFPGQTLVEKKTGTTK